MRSWTIGQAILDLDPSDTLEVAFNPDTGRVRLYARSQEQVKSAKGSLFSFVMSAEQFRHLVSYSSRLAELVDGQRVAGDRPLEKAKES